MKRITTYFAMISLLLVVLLSACQNESNTPIAETENIELISEKIPELSVFNLPSEWINQDSETIKLIDYRGKTTVLALIFTTCQYACPRLIADMQSIENTLSPEELAKTNFVLVSIDPDNDTPEVLKQFSEEKGLDLGHWSLLHGPNENVLELAVTLGVKYKKNSAIDFSHSNIISVFNTEGELEYQQEGFGVENITISNKIKELLP